MFVNEASVWTCVQSLVLCHIFIGIPKDGGELTQTRCILQTFSCVQYTTVQL